LTVRTGDPSALNQTSDSAKEGQCYLGTVMADSVFSMMRSLVAFEKSGLNFEGVSKPAAVTPLILTDSHGSYCCSSEETMHDIERRAFVRGAAIGALAFSVSGAEILLTPGAARAQGVPLRTLSAAQAETLEAVGETLVPGARQAGVAHFVDQQISIPAEEALLEARILNVWHAAWADYSQLR
jgi:hypothetical protein